MTWQNFRINTRLNQLKSTDIERIYSLIAEIDAVKNNWHLTKKLSPQVIQRLTQSVIITSTGASNRIEGNRLTDAEVEELYSNLRIKKLKTRDDQEVVGYLEMMTFIFEHYQEFKITESHILQIHQGMLAYSEKDTNHKGHYKVGLNRVEAKDQSGNLVGVIFDPTAPHLVKKEMHELIDWYNWAIAHKIKHPLILIANFIFEFLAIHPFQDGNGRSSRLLTNLMLLQQAYNFTTVVSHEKIIENHKVDYYLALNKTQSSWKTAQEDLAPWLIFFLNVIKLQATEALRILEGNEIEYLLSVKQLALWQWALQNSPKEFTRREAIKAMEFPARTVESIIKKLVALKRLQRLGEGSATRYKVIN
ncbi:MAG TPA: Fic family protein [Candidatus Babeliales bacterium]|nr:Fic family protein [Candidatus Babeliales bacterium]